MRVNLARDLRVRYPAAPGTGSRSGPLTPDAGDDDTAPRRPRGRIGHGRLAEQPIGRPRLDAVSRRRAR